MHSSESKKSWEVLYYVKRGKVNLPLFSGKLYKTLMFLFICMYVVVPLIAILKQPIWITKGDRYSVVSKVTPLGFVVLPPHSGKDFPGGTGSSSIA